MLTENRELEAARKRVSIDFKENLKPMKPLAACC